MLTAQSTIRLHDEATSRWHSPESKAGHITASAEADSLASLLLALHRANFDLWHEEDAARSPEASDEAIAQVKHAIDRHNQQRNDLVERIDTLLLEDAGAQNPAAPLHSETPGLILDRLSILALKIYHTRLEVERPSATDQHHARNGERLRILTEQRADLALCLDALWAEIVTGTRRFRLYRQLKMYNDPELNPVLYTRHR